MSCDIKKLIDNLDLADKQLDAESWNNEQVA
jgi:hypothetical protein